MPTAKRDLAIAALATRLNATRNPYPQDYDETPFYALIEGEETVLSRDYDDVLVVASLTVEAINRYDEDASRTTAANALLAYLISTALGADPTLGGLAEVLALAPEAAQELGLAGEPETASASSTHSESE